MNWKVGSNEKSGTNINPSFEKLQKLYIDFLSTFEIITKYESKLHSISLADYNKERVEKQKLIQSVPKLIENMNSLKKEVNSDPKIDEVKRKQLKLIANNMISKQEELEITLNNIINQEKSLNKRFSLYQLNAGIDIRNSIISSNENIQNKTNETLPDDFRGSLVKSYSEKFEELNIEENNFILEQREKELKEILVVSNHIKDMTSNMKVEVVKQGQLIGKP